MLYALIIIIVIGILFNNQYQNYSFKGLYYKLTFSKNLVECGEDFDIFLILENKKILPLTYVQINQEYPKNLEFKGLDREKGLLKTNFSLLPYQRIKRSMKVRCSSRGRFLLSNAELICGDFLGIKTYVKGYDVMSEVVALPMPYDITKKIKPYGSFMGDISIKRWIIEDPIISIGIRSYTGNEPLKYIHWPSSLKNQTLMVKEFDFTTDNNVLLALNIETCKPFWRFIDAEKAEKCISIARTLVDELEKTNIPYGIISNSQNFVNLKLENPSLGKKHYLNVLEALGRIDYNISMGFENLLSQYKFQKYTTLIIITSYVLDEYIKYMVNLSNIYQKVVIISIDSNNLNKISKNIEIYYEGND